MGLIKAALNAGKSVLADQWLEYVTCENAGDSVLIKRGTVHNKNNNNGTSNVLTNGSRIVVPEGFAMMVLDQGRVTEFSAEAGEFTYNSGTEPTVLYGGLGKGIMDSIKTFADRFKFAGNAPKETLVYYVNLREITGNKFGTSNPIPFDDPKYMSIEIRYFGVYSLKVSDPVILVRNLVGGGLKDKVEVSDYVGQLKSEFLMSLTSAMSKMAYEKNISFNKLPMFQEELSVYMNDKMDESWTTTRGLEIVAVAVESISVAPEYKDKIAEYDKYHMAEVRGQGMITAATADAMVKAAANEGGNAGMFMGMNVGQMMAGAMGTGAQLVQQKPAEEPAKEMWTCDCGHKNSMDSKFCAECGSKKPEEWTCECGYTGKGNFCPKCGKKKPEKRVCPKCGQEVTTNFCSNCGTKVA